MNGFGNSKSKIQKNDCVFEVHFKFPKTVKSRSRAKVEVVDVSMKSTRASIVA